jgi:hypothetical protein
MPATSFLNRAPYGGRKIFPRASIFVCVKTLRAWEKVRKPSRAW